MSIAKVLEKIIQAIQEVTQKVINYISVAAARIFSPRDDDYPATGIQPFEGDSADA
ncbi:MAG: hypothetical protein KME23_21950 [Goleter apudmare HA4340-LM2]|jgi:hypothetical protein|nr:hypothetical protein [Goleter apudmare HA4340-LM2]